MEFKNYCIIVFGNLTNVDKEVMSMSETPISMFSPEGGSLFVATFSSLAEVSHLTEFFKSGKRNFVLYELNPATSGQYFQVEVIQEGLFGFLKHQSDEILKNRTEEFLKVVSGVTTTPKASKPVKKNINSEDYINSLSSQQKNDLMNDILKKTPSLMTKEDKELLSKLAK